MGHLSAYPQPHRNQVNYVATRSPLAPSSLAARGPSLPIPRLSTCRRGGAPFRSMRRVVALGSMSPGVQCPSKGPPRYFSGKEKGNGGRKLVETQLPGPGGGILGQPH